MEGSAFTDVLECLVDPVSYFICQGALLKEAVDDVEWTKGAVTIELVRDPPVVRFKSSRDGLALEVRFFVIVLLFIYLFICLSAH